MLKAISWEREARYVLMEIAEETSLPTALNVLLNQDYV